MQKRLAMFGLVAGLVGGSVAGATLAAPGLVGAQSPSTTPSTAAGDPAKADESGWVRKAIDPLVANGTITQAQADAVVNTLQQAKPERGRGHRGFGLDLDTAAGKIGISPDALRQALAGGQSIADVAKSKNVDPQVVIDALVAKVQSDTAAKVAGGSMTQAQADQRLAKAKEAITAIVNGQMPVGKGPGFGRRGGPARSQTPSPSSTSSTTTA
jgi:hypothetical protein